MGSFDERLRTWAACLADSWSTSPQVAGCEGQDAKERNRAGLHKGNWGLQPICNWGLHHCVRGVDRALRKVMGIREFCARPDCIFRVAECSSTEFILLRDRTTIFPGERFGDLHLSNENIERMLGGAVGLGLGTRFRTAFLESLRDLAWHAATDESMAHMKAFRAQVCWLWRTRKDSLNTIIRQCGFDIFLPDPPWIRQLHDALENLLIYGLVWSFNPNGLKRRCLTPLRLQLWISREELLRRHWPEKNCQETSMSLSSRAVYAGNTDERCPCTLDRTRQPDKLRELLSVKEYHR